MSDETVTCARCGKIVPQEWAFIEEGDEWECPHCWHRCEETDMRKYIARLRDELAEARRIIEKGERMFGSLWMGSTESKP